MCSVIILTPTCCSATILKRRQCCISVATLSKLLTTTYLAQQYYSVDEVRYYCVRITDEVKVQKHKEYAILCSSLTIEGIHCYVSMGTLSIILLNMTCSSTIPKFSVHVPWQQWSRERATMLRYTCIAYLFICMISSFRRDVNEIFALVGCYAVLIGS
jgi:hypothetical protein